MKLCTDPEPKVHGIAFDALRSIGITDVAGFTALLTNENVEIGQLAAELVPGLTEVPDAAIVPLTAGSRKSDRTNSCGSRDGTRDRRTKG